jgi:hypothetical protein
MMGSLRRSKVNWSGEFNDDSWISVRCNRRSAGSGPGALGFARKAKDIMPINSLYLMRKRGSIFHTFDVPVAAE